MALKVICQCAVIRVHRRLTFPAWALKLSHSTFQGTIAFELVCLSLLLPFDLLGWHPHFLYTLLFGFDHFLISLLPSIYLVKVLGLNTDRGANHETRL